MAEYIRVAEDEATPEDAIELPSDDDGSVQLSTIQAQFPGSTGLRFRNEETQTWRGVRLADGVLYPPVGGWGSALYIVVSSKTDSSSKRKYEESPTGREPNPKIMKNYTMETDDEYAGDLIILGLSWKAKDDDVKDYFARFGELDYHEVKRSPATGQSRGFGFIRFKDGEVAKNVMSRSHTILDRRVDIRLSKGKDDSPRKIFIGRLPNNCTAMDIRTYFEKFGPLSDVYLPQPFRQFGFVTFASGDVARNVISHVHMINGTRVNVTAAEPKSNKGFHTSPNPMSRNVPRGYAGWNNMQAYANYGDRANFNNQMNAMWNMAAMNSMAQGMAGGMGSAGMGGGMGSGMAGGMQGSGMSAAAMGGGMGTPMSMGAMTASGMGGGMGSGGMSNAMAASSGMGGGAAGGGGGMASVGSSGMESGMNSNMNGSVNSDVSYALWNRDTARS